jgi:hypothetical protein
MSCIIIIRERIGRLRATGIILLMLLVEEVVPVAMVVIRFENVV